MLVAFREEEGQPTAVLPSKRVRGCTLDELEKGVMCRVEWSDRKVYQVEVLATGL